MTDIKSKYEIADDVLIRLTIGETLALGYAKLREEKFQIESRLRELQIEYEKKREEIYEKDAMIEKLKTEVEDLESEVSDLKSRMINEAI